MKKSSMTPEERFYKILDDADKLEKGEPTERTMNQDETIEDLIDRVYGGPKQDTKTE